MAGHVTYDRSYQMADTFCHGTQGGMFVLAPLLSRIQDRTWLWILVFLGVVVGALPDLFGAYGLFILNDHWALYVNAHSGAIAGVLKYIPMYWLHLLVDSITHGEGHRWWVWNERLWLEILLWAVNGLVIWWLVKRWRERSFDPRSHTKEWL